MVVLSLQSLKNCTRTWPCGCTVLQSTCKCAPLTWPSRPPSYLRCKSVLNEPPLPGHAVAQCTQQRFRGLQVPLHHQQLDLQTHIQCTTRVTGRLGLHVMPKLRLPRSCPNPPRPPALPRQILIPELGGDRPEPARPSCLCSTCRRAAPALIPIIPLH